MLKEKRQLYKLSLTTCWRHSAQTRSLLHIRKPKPTVPRRYLRTRLQACELKLKLGHEEETDFNFIDNESYI